VVEGFARVYELIVSFITLSSARALALGASILRLLGLVPDDLSVRLLSVGGKAGSSLGGILRSLQGEQFLSKPSRQRSGD
jgi:hypothetical protein